MQIIADATKGIYQNILTIAQSLAEHTVYGLYNCIVENPMGSSNRTNRYSGKISSYLRVSRFFMQEWAGCAIPTQKVYQLLYHSLIPRPLPSLPLLAILGMMIQLYHSESDLVLFIPSLASRLFFADLVRTSGKQLYKSSQSSLLTHTDFSNTYLI